MGRKEDEKEEIQHGRVNQRKEERKEGRKRWMKKTKIVKAND